LAALERSRFVVFSGQRVLVPSFKRGHAAATWRIAFSGGRAHSRAVHVGVHHRHAASDRACGSLGWQKGTSSLAFAGIRGIACSWMLYTLTKVPALLVGIQALDGVANCIFVVVSILVIADLTQGTGRFNLAAGAMATVQGIGAALSNTLGGLLIQRFGFNASFARLALIGVLAVSLLFWKVPETKGYTSRQAEGPNGAAFALRDFAS
jgi:MFS family permease